MAQDPPAPPRSGLSLYANLLESKSTPGTISSAPVTYKQPEPEQDEAAKKQQALAASLRFQPTKRPQQQNAAAVAAKAKAKAIASKLGGAPIATEVSPPTHDKSEPVAPKTSAADWIATNDEDEYFYNERRERGGRKKRKKKKEVVEVVQDWDDIYDPSRPNNYEEYKHSEEKIREVRDWKDLLYRHRLKRRDSSYETDQSEREMNRRFAPPPSFAPPSSFAPTSDFNNDPPPPPLGGSDYATGEDAYDIPPPPPANVPDDPTGDAAYARRLRLSQAPPPPPPEPISQPTPSAGQIARAPVRYSLPPPPEELPASEAELQEQIEEAEQPRSSRPGQAGFAERLLSKYGWSKGQGLGANQQGIVNPLYAKADKRKKKSDADGGGFVTPASTGKILGGYKPKAGDEEGKFGAMSEVIRLEHMLDGMDLDKEMTKGEGGIMQEIGEECGEKYGSVERVYIHRVGSPVVFVQFVSQLSGLRAVNALEGRVFGGNTITARFWPTEEFLKGQNIADEALL